jgi:hypothetical protein
MSDDHSPGDRRQPYSDQGGPAGRHARTHDVRREAHTNPTGPDATDDSFDEQLQPGGRVEPPGHAEESTPASEDKTMHRQFQELSAAELDRLSLLDSGVDLEQGGVYLDLDRRDQGPFKAIGGQTVEQGQRIISKRDTDYELWNEQAGDAEPRIERPETASDT